MRRAGPAVLLVAVGLTAGCGSGAKSVVAPSGHGVLHSLRADKGAEISTARRSNEDLFRIFPARTGSKACSIPDGGIAAIRGSCRTSITYPNEHGPSRLADVRFRERWGGGHSSSWTVIVEWPALKIAGTQLHGETAPQMRYVITDRVADRPLLAGEVEMVAYSSGDVRICGVQSSDLMFGQGPPDCRHDLRAVGVRVAALNERPTKPGVRWGSLYLVGTYRDGVFRVTSQQRWAPPGRGPGPFFERPPCPAPGGGWRVAPPTYAQKATIGAYERRYRGDVTSVVYFHHTTIPVVSSLHPARARAALARYWPRQVCVVRARYPLAAVSRARRRFRRLLGKTSRAASLGWISGAGGLGESDRGQPTTPVEVLVETPALRRIVRSESPGLVEIDAALAPLRP